MTEGITRDGHGPIVLDGEKIDLWDTVEYRIGGKAYSIRVSDFATEAFELKPEPPDGESPKADKLATAHVLVSKAMQTLLKENKPPKAPYWELKVANRLIGEIRQQTPDIESAVPAKAVPKA